MILYKITVVGTNLELYGKNLDREIKLFMDKHYIVKNMTNYEVDKDSLMISFDSADTWEKVEDNE